MNTFQLDCFLSVAYYLNFAKAAEHMNISQPAVTHQIQTLESELHTKLFHRTTRSVELTIEGHTFLSDAREIVTLSKRALRRFEQEDEQEIIDFTVGCTAHVQSLLLPEIIRKLVEVHPNLHPKILTLPITQLLNRVEEGTVQIALGLKTDIKKGSLTYREFKKIPVICVYQKDHPFTAKDSVLMEDLKSSKLILYHPRTISLEIIHLQNKLSESRKLSDLYFCESEETALILVQAGLGVAILLDIFLSDTFGTEGNFNDLKKCRIADADEHSFGYYYKNLSGNKPLRDFIRFLKETMNTNISYATKETNSIYE